MCSYACMLQTIDTTKDSFINRMMARNILQFRLYSSWKRKKINLVQLNSPDLGIMQFALIMKFGYLVNLA